MRSFFLYILTLLYLASTTGAMLETHFCMGKLADWSIGDSSGEHCGLCGMPKNDGQDNGCCSDEESFLKITDDQKASSGIATPTLSPDLDLPVRIAYQPIDQVHAPGKHILVQSPPGSPGRSRYVLISVFRI